MTYRICSISGGGVRGIIPATIVKEMLDIAKKNGGKGEITDLCDYVVGTSVGGIVGAGLVASQDGRNSIFTPKKVLDLLKDKADEIFPEDANYYQHLGIGIATGLLAAGSALLLPTIGAIAAAGAINAVFGTALATTKLIGWWGATSAAIALGGIAGVGAYQYSGIFDGLFAPKYSREGIDIVLNESFGDLRLSNTVVPFTTVSYSLEQNNPRVWSTFKAWQTTNDDFFIKDALGATSAAPTFFPHKVTNVTTAKGSQSYHDIDGGIFANSPVNIAISVLVKHAPQEVQNKIAQEGITVLSIGTGYYKGPELFVPPSSFAESKFGYGLQDPLVLKVMDAIERDSIIQARYLHNTIRLDPKLDKSLMPMDRSDAEHIKRLSKAADDYVSEHKKVIEGYVKCMLQDRMCEELVTESTPEHSYETFEF